MPGVKTMISTPITIPVPLRTDQDGVIRVGNTRVTLLTVVNRYRVGDSAEAIHEGFPTLSLAEIHAVIAYYLQNRSEIDAYIQQIETEAERWRTEYEANNPQAAAFNVRMRALLDEKRKVGES